MLQPATSSSSSSSIASTTSSSSSFSPTSSTSTTVSVSSTTSTTSSAVSSPSSTCGGTYTASNGQAFHVDCQMDYSFAVGANVISSYMGGNRDRCMDACSTTAGCQAISFLFSNSQCTLLSDISMGGGHAPADRAVLVNYVPPVSSTSSSVTSTSSSVIRTSSSIATTTSTASSSSFSSTSSTSSATAAPSSTCGGTYTAPDGRVFSVECSKGYNYALGGNGLGSVTTDSREHCMDACDNTSGCQAINWYASRGECAMMSDIASGGGNAPSDRAVLVNYVPPSSSTSSASTILSTTSSAAAASSTATTTTPPPSTSSTTTTTSSPISTSSAAAPAQNCYSSFASPDGTYSFTQGSSYYTYSLTCNNVYDNYLQYSLNTTSVTDLKGCVNNCASSNLCQAIVRQISTSKCYMLYTIPGSKSANSDFDLGYLAGMAN